MGCVSVHAKSDQPIKHHHLHQTEISAVVSPYIVNMQLLYTLGKPWRRSQSQSDPKLHSDSRADLLIARQLYSIKVAYLEQASSTIR